MSDGWTQSDGRERTNEDSKQDQLEQHKRKNDEQFLTTAHGVRVHHTDDSLKAGERGPTLMEDFHFREKMMHFDHERIPERVVHARGSGAHGYFQVYESMAEYTRAGFLQDPSVRTPVFVRFSTVVGSRGSADTVRDVRGFATKFYTGEGNFDLVANNIPVFFIQDGIKFPDLVHSIKPEPHNEIPQATAAHDNFWDFFSQMPESTHMIVWLMSDRAIPRSFRMMEGFGVHTFRFVNAEGRARFIKFHWKPMLGTHSLVWDEAQKLAGKDPDWLRRDLWNAIEMGDYPEFELGVQIVEEDEEFNFDFDLLDPTKIIPEELVPVMRIGKMVLNRNPDNFFAETEQVAFHPGHVVPGIDFTNDPLLQGRLFSYLDTQLLRLGSPNFNEIPINRPVAPVNNNQQGGFMRQTINKGRTNYLPNTLAGGCPMTASGAEGGYVHYTEKVDGRKIRDRSESFKDHFTQAALFWNSMTEAEKQHIVDAFHFEIGKVKSKEVREAAVAQIAHVDTDLAAKVAQGVGVEAPTGIPPAEPRAMYNARDGQQVTIDQSPAVSMEDTVTDTIKSRRIAVVLADGYEHSTLEPIKQMLMNDGASVQIISKHRGTVNSADGAGMEVDKNYVAASSVMYDAVLIPDGHEHVSTLMKQGDALHFVNEAFRHCKAVAALGEGVELLEAAYIMDVELAGAGSDGQVIADKGVVTTRNVSDVDGFAGAFKQAIARHRHWEREAFKEQVPA